MTFKSQHWEDHIGHHGKWRMAEGSSCGDVFSDVKQSYRVTCYELLDVLVDELKSRFKDQEVSVLISMERIFVGAYSDTEPSEDSLQNIVTFYQSDVDERRLRNELMVLPIAIITICRNVLLQDYKPQHVAQTAS